MKFNPAPTGWPLAPVASVHVGNNWDGCVPIADRTAEELFASVESDGWVHDRRKDKRTAPRYAKQWRQALEAHIALMEEK